MNNTYTLHIQAQCPIDDAVDTYKCIIQCAGFMMEVEKILEHTSKYKNVKIFQEKLSKKLSLHFNSKVTLIGLHSGVTIESVCDV